MVAASPFPIGHQRPSLPAVWQQAAQREPDRKRVDPLFSASSDPVTQYRDRQFDDDSLVPPHLPMERKENVSARIRYGVPAMHDE